MSLKIDFTDPKVIRHWEERIARFEGLDIDPKKGKEKYIRTKSGLKYNWPQKIPSYHASLTDLFRVLRKIGFYTVVGDDSVGHDCYIGEGRIRGSRCFDTPEQAIFQAICQYIDQNAPAPH